MLVLMIAKWVGDPFNISLYDLHLNLKGPKPLYHCSSRMQHCSTTALQPLPWSHAGWLQEFLLLKLNHLKSSNSKQVQHTLMCSVIAVVVIAVVVWSTHCGCDGRGCDGLGCVQRAIL